MVIIPDKATWKEVEEIYEKAGVPRRVWNPERAWKNLIDYLRMCQDKEIRNEEESYKG